MRQTTAQPRQRRRPTTIALETDDFHCIAVNGFGCPENSYAHSMTWFNGHLYVGTSRGILAMVRVNNPPPALTYWPINSPEDVYQMDRRAQMWRYAPRKGEWEMVFRSPMVPGKQGEPVAHDIGYRGCAVHRVPGSTLDALYVCSWSSSRAPPPRMMRSFDGKHFETVPGPPWGDAVNTFRALKSFKGRLFTAPTGSTAGYGQAEECVSGAPVVWTTHDPEREPWTPASPAGFGDLDNLTIFEMEVFDDHLYAGTINANGYQIWKTRAEGEPPFPWHKVVEQGAYRGATNQIAVSLCPFKGCLYVGSGIINGGYDRRRKIGPAAGEVIRIYPDDSWDLVVGDARSTPAGMKHPISTYAAGFDNFFNGYIWRMAVHDGHLYLGTFKWNGLLPYMPFDQWPGALQLMIEARGVDDIVRESGGFDLWRTADGVNWIPVTRTGFGTPFNWGVRTLVSTKHGLFLGSANPFGGEVAYHTAHGWEYFQNPRGATEIWLGTKHMSAEAALGVIDVRTL